MRYEIGNIDRYSVAVNGTVMENAAFFTIRAKERFDEKKLLAAVEKALLRHPLFKTRVVYDKGYFLETNNNPIEITCASEEERPKTFGKTTNDYPWRISYDKENFYFEWCHVISDGRGALRFVSDILNAYYAIAMPKVESFPLGLGFESFNDKTVKPFGQVKQAAGFRAQSFPAIKRGFKCQSHILSLATRDILFVAKKNDTTPAAILAPLLCKAIRERIPESVKNRNVSCGIIVDCRKPMNFDTMHNFILNKVITYTDRFDKYDLQTLGTIYRGILDIFTQKENIIAACSAMIAQTDAVYRLRPKSLMRFVMKAVARITKNHMNNICLTYLGKTPFSPELSERLAGFGVRSWPDVGQCVAAVIDFNERLYIDICENYRDREVVNAFIKVCAAYGLDVKKESECIFEQAAMIL